MMDYTKYVGMHFNKPDACVSLAILISNEMFQRDIPPLDIKQSLEYLRTHLVHTETPVEGDIILMKGEEWHVGIIIAAGCMIHTFMDGSAIIEKYNGLFWKNRIRGYYTWI